MPLEVNVFGANPNPNICLRDAISNELTNVTLCRKHIANSDVYYP